MTLPEVTALDLDQADEWLTIWFNEPDSRNALTQQLTDDLLAVLDAVRDSHEVRGITLRGRHGIFCSGGDLKSFRSNLQNQSDPDAVMAASKRGARIFDTVNTMPQVVIAVVEGAAMAGGFGLACCADVAIVHADAKFAFTETAIGLTPAQIAPFVIQKLGLATARRLMLTAARFDGRTATELGFADILAETPEDIETAELTIRRQVLRSAPGAVADIKSLIRDLPDLERAAQIEAAAKNFTGRMLSDEGREGVASFLEKRKPNWVREV